MAKAEDNSKPRTTTSKTLDQAAIDRRNDEIRERLALLDEQSLGVQRKHIFELLKKGLYSPKMAAEELAALPEPTIRRKPEPDENTGHAALIKAVREGTMTPVAAAKSLATDPVGKAKRTRKGKQMARVRPIVCKLYPPDGIAPDNVKTWQALMAVKRDYPEASRDVVARAIGRRRD